MDRAETRQLDYQQNKAFPNISPYGDPDPRRPVEVSRGLFDKHHWKTLGSPGHLLLYLIHECRGQSPWAFGRQPRSLDKLHEATGVPTRTLRRWIKVLELDHPGADGSVVPHGYLRTWRFREGLVFLVVERISFEKGRGRKADTSRYLDPAFRPELHRARKDDPCPRPELAGVNGQKWPQTPEREVPQEPTGQTVLPLGPLGASTENRKLPSGQRTASQADGEAVPPRSAASAAPSRGKPRGQPPAPPPPGDARRMLGRVLREFPRLNDIAKRQALQAALIAAANEARGVGLAALEHGFRCALMAVQRYQDRAGRVELRSSFFAVVRAVIPGEAMTWNAARGEAEHEARKLEDRELAAKFSQRLETMLVDGVEFGAAAARAAGS